MSKHGEPSGDTGQLAFNEQAAGSAGETKSQSTGASIPRRRFFSDMPDKGLFGIAAFAGFAGICFLKLNGYSANVIAALAVVAMIVYGGVAYQMPLVQMRLDRLGDNFYYLGFIYTLASLTAALIELQHGTEVQNLLESFGIALVTTIVGIAGRVMFVQLRSDLDDIEETVRRDLAATSNELRAQFLLSIREFETFRTALMQTLEETRTECAKSAKEQINEISEFRSEFMQTLEEARTQFEKSTKHQISKISELAHSSAKHIKDTFDTNRQDAEALSSSLNEISTAVEQATKKLESMELPNDRLNSDLGRFTENLEAQLRRLGGVIEQIAHSVPHNQRRRWYWPFRRK